MKFVVGENGRNPEKNLPRPHFIHHETHMEWPRRELGTPAVGGERYKIIYYEIEVNTKITAPVKMTGMVWEGSNEAAVLVVLKD